MKLPASILATLALAACEQAAPSHSTAETARIVEPAAAPIVKPKPPIVVKPVVKPKRTHDCLECGRG